LIQAVLTRLNSRLGKIGVTLSVLNYCQAVVGFAVNFYLARRLGAAGYGLVSYGLVAGTIAYTVINFGAERTLVRDLVQRSDPDRVLTASLVMRFLIGVAVVAVLALVLPQVIADVQKMRIVLICTLASVFWAVAPVGWFDTKYRMHHHALITLCERSVYAVLVFIVVLQRGADSVIGVVLCLLLTRLASTAAQLLIVGRQVAFDVTDLRSNIRWLMSGNVLIVLATLSNLLISHWNQLALEHRLSSSQLGMFALAFQITAVITLLQGQVIRLFVPRIAELTGKDGDAALARRSVVRYAAFCAALSLVIVVPLYLLAPRVITGLFPPEYAGSVAPLRILCLWSVIYGGGRVINAFLVNLRLNRELLMCSVGGGIVSVALGWLLIPLQGPAGVALALLVGHPVSIFAQGFFVRRELDRRRLESV